MSVSPDVSRLVYRETCRENLFPVYFRKYSCFVVTFKANIKSMSYTQSPLYSIINNKCPNCRKGNFFETNNAYNLKKFATMNSRCSLCSEDFRREPGYYFGASYVSYTLTVIFGFGLYIILAGIFDMGTLTFLIIFSALLIVLLPVFYRYARLIWIHIFVPYRKS